MSNCENAICLRSMIPGSDRCFVRETLETEVNLVTAENIAAMVGDRFSVCPELTELQKTYSEKIQQAAKLLELNATIREELAKRVQEKKPRGRKGR